MRSFLLALLCLATTLPKITYANPATIYGTTICSEAVQEKVNSYCSQTDCGPLFNDENQPIKPGHVDKIKAVVPQILEIADKYGISPDWIVGALLTVQVKGGYRTVPVAYSGSAAQVEVDPQSGAIQPNPGSGAFQPTPNAASGEIIAIEPRPGSGEVKEAVPNPGSGGVTQVTPNPGSGEDKEIVPNPGSGEVTRVTPDPISGEAKVEPNPGSGEVQGTQAIQCRWESGYNNLARLDHEGPRQAEEYLSQLQGREMRTCEQVKQAINHDGEDILYLAAMLIRNQEIFAEYGLNYDLGIAVTLYGFSDVEGTAQKVQSQNRQPRPNSWGLYAECQKPLIQEILNSVLNHERP